MSLKSKSGAVFVNEKDLKRWEELEAEIILNDKEFNIFNSAQWSWLNKKVVPLLNKARKGI